MQIGSESLLKRQGRKGLAVRAVLVARLPRNSSCHYKGWHCPLELTRQGPQSTCNSSGREVDWRAVSAHKSFPPLPKEGLVKVSGPGSLDGNPKSWDFYELAFLLK